MESFVHAGFENDIRIRLKWVNTEYVSPGNELKYLANVAGILVPGGFGERGIEGKLTTIKYARIHKIPFFGICLGLQCAVIEFARNVVKLKNANSSEFDPDTLHPVIDIMEDQKRIKQKGGTMRLGAYECVLTRGSKAHAAYQNGTISERHRHRFEVNNAYRERLVDSGLIISGTAPDNSLVEMVELADHPWFVSCQFHPELKSRAMRAHPLFRDFVKASLEYSA